MTWEIAVPYRGEDDWTLDVIPAAREVLEGDDLKVVEQVAYDAMVRGKTKIGDLLNELEAAGPDGRRRIVDKARVACGLDTLEDAAAHQRFLQANAALRGTGRDAGGKSIQGCHAPDCQAMPVDELGAPVPSAASRWFCSRHEDQAQPGDLDPPEPKYVIDFATMSVKAVGREQERLLEEDRERERQAAAREQRRREESERLGKLEEEYRATLKLPVGWGPQ